MATKPNTVLYAVVAAATATVLAAALLAASAHGKRRARKAWLIERGAS